jgi:4'-phosphopantetheinyl transferase
MAPFAIPPGEVHLWWASLAVNTRDEAALRRILDPRELERADRFRVPGAARRFITARAVLRTLLGRVLGTPPETIEFSYGERGKPAVAGAPHFNTSDSADTVVVAMASEEIGVDVEVVRPLTNRDRLARRICTENELEQLAALPESEVAAALLRLWTFKEAALKAVGLGLPGGLRNVEVDFLPGRPPRLRRLREHLGGWSLMTADLDHPMLCSIVVRSSPWSLVSRKLDPRDFLRQ